MSGHDRLLDRMLAAGGLTHYGRRDEVAEVSIQAVLSHFVSGVALLQFLSFRVVGQRGRSSVSS